MKFQVLIKLKYRQIKKFLALSLSGVVFIMLINVKTPTFVGVLIFMSRINLSVKSFIYPRGLYVKQCGSRSDLIFCRA